MARVSHDKAMKEMVIKVKELCKDVDDNAIQILLQQYDFNVEHTVQAILDGGVEETLGEWKSLGGNSKTTAAKKKKKNKNKNPAQNLESSNGPSSVQNVNHVTSNISGLCNGGSVLSDSKGLNGAFLSGPEFVEPQECSPSSFDQPSLRHSAQQSRPKEDYKQQTKKARDRTISEASTSSGIDRPSKGSHAGLEKSLKDLQRQTVSLQRLKVVLNEQVDKSFKRISEVFKELHNQLNEREAQLIFSMDKVKTQANDILEEQQLKALDLKHQTDRAQVMKDSELAELRSRIKVFVGERKHYEDLSHAQRFVCDFNHILEELKNFGEVVPVKAAPDHRRSSLVSLGSSVSHEEVSSPSRPSITAASSYPYQTSLVNNQASAALPVPVAAATTAAAPSAAAISISAAVPTVFVPNSAHVLMQSESLTKYEATEMAQRLANLALGDSVASSTSSTFRSPRADRGHSSRGRGSGNSRANTDRSAMTKSDDQERDTRPAQSRGQGGQGQGRSNRGRGESGNANESSLGNVEQRSNKSKDANAKSNVDNVKAHDQASNNATASKEAVTQKSPEKNTSHGGNRALRHDNPGGTASGDSLVKSDTSARSTHKRVMNHDHDRGESGKSSAAIGNSDVLLSSSKPVPDGLTNGQAEALPQRVTRSHRGGVRNGAEIQSMETQEPVLSNGD